MTTREFWDYHLHLQIKKLSLNKVTQLAQSHTGSKGIKGIYLDLSTQIAALMLLTTIDTASAPKSWEVKARNHKANQN